MSTIVVVRKDGQAAIAADSLTRFGYTKESANYVRNHEKILKVGGSYLGVTGSMTSNLALRDYFSNSESKAKLNSVESIFATWNKLHRVLKEQYFVNPTEDSGDSYESSRMEVLIANPYGIFGVAAFRAVQEFTKFYAYGGGCDFALGAMFAIYNDGNRTAEDIARIGVQAAAEFDDGTGLPMVCHTLKLRA
jgi:ATP-dependent HslUV protease subunit HslV